MLPDDDWVAIHLVIVAHVDGDYALSDGVEFCERTNEFGSVTLLQ